MERLTPIPLKLARAGKRYGRLVARATFVAVTVLGLVYVGVSLFTADQLTRSTNHPLTIDPHVVSADVTPWSTQTDDGITLRGWYLPTERQRHLIVLVHGMWSSWREMAWLGRDLHERDFDVLLFDLRGHGQSDPSRLYLGRRERGDIRAVMDWAQSHGFERDRVGWLGYSMGGATLLMQAARDPRIQVAVVDSPFGNLPEVLEKQLSKHSGLPRVFNPGILLAARLFFGVRTDDLVPIRFARAWGERPLLLIHGESDSTVPLSQAYALAQAAGSSCQTITWPGVEHVKAYDSDPEQYVQTVGAFFNDHLRP